MGEVKADTVLLGIIALFVFWRWVDANPTAQVVIRRIKQKLRVGKYRRR